MILGITCHDDRMKASALVCAKYMKLHRVDTAIIANTKLEGRGAGYWRWMPELVVKYLKFAIEYNYSFLVYSDAGVQFIQDIRHITDRMSAEDHVFLFGNEHPHVEWCKGDVLEAMQWSGSDTDKQVQASVHVWRASEEALKIAEEWLDCCKLDWMIDDSPSTVPNHPKFKEHRHPQAVLTNIAYEHKIKLHWWPTEYGIHVSNRYPADTYPMMFNHHRRRDPGVNEAQQPEWTQSEYELIMKALS